MTAFGIPEEPQEHWKLEGWRMHIAQCATAHEVVGADFDIRRRAAWAVKRGVPMPWVPAALALCAKRHSEILAMEKSRER